MKEKKIICKQCKKEFNFTIGEQQWYAEHSLNEPKYCKDCRKIRKDEKTNSSKQNVKWEEK